MSINTHIDEFIEIITYHNDINSDSFRKIFHDKLKIIENLSYTIDCIENIRREFLKKTNVEFSKSKIISHGRNKPYGYSGDFQIIDWTYQKKVLSDNERGKKWDTFYHSQVAPRAVCSRKERFGRTLKQICSEIDERPLRVLNVGSGPAREIVDGARYAGLCPESLTVECIDSDEHAISYAKDLLGSEWEHSVKFVKRNALRYRTTNRFHFVWSSGLFDYFNHKLASHLLKTLYEATEPSGFIEIGNFSDTHETRPWIEWCGDWFLIHRTQNDMELLCESAGISTKGRIYQSIDDLNAVRFLTFVRYP